MRNIYKDLLLLHHLLVCIYLVFCLDFNDCLLPDNPCEQECTNTFQSYICSCFGGYTLANATHCEDIDECSVNATICDGLPNTYCNNTIGSFSCECLSGYRRNSNGTCAGNFFCLLLWKFLVPEAATKRCSIKKLFLEISQNSKENTCARVSFLIKLQAWGLQLYLKSDSGAGVFL